MFRMKVFVRQMENMIRENTYTEVRGHSLSPHVGGILRVTHHLQRVYLKTSIHK